MDPLSIASATVGFVSVVKELISLAQKIKKSVEKVPKNRESLHKLAADLVLELQEFEGSTTKRKEVFEESKELLATLVQFQDRLGVINARCIKLLPQKGQGWKRIALAITSWANCDEIEAEILILKRDIQSCYIKLTASVALEAHPRLHKIEHAILKLENDQKTRLKELEASIRTSALPSSTITILTASTLPISENDEDKAMVHKKIDKIIQKLGNLSTAFADEEPIGFYRRPFEARFFAAQLTTVVDEDEHQVVLKRTMDILVLLIEGGREGKLSVQDGAWQMSKLTAYLHKLEMSSDALTVGRWTADLYRLLCKTDKSTYQPYLISNLHNLATLYYNLGNMQDSRSTAEEAITLLREPDQAALWHTRLQLVESLNQLWRTQIRDGDLEMASKVASESLEVMREIEEEVGAWVAVAQTSSSAVESDASQPSPSREGWNDDAVLQFKYSKAQVHHQQWYILVFTEGLEQALASEHGPIARQYVQELTREAPGIFDNVLAEYLMHMYQPYLLLKIIPTPSEALQLSQDSTNLYRKLAMARTKFFSQDFFRALFHRAQLLQNASHEDEAVEVLREAVAFMRSSDTEPVTRAEKLMLCSWLCNATNRSDMSADIQSEAIELYRATTKDLPPTDPLFKKVTNYMNLFSSSLQVIGRLQESILGMTEVVERWRLILKAEYSLAHAQALGEALSALCWLLSLDSQYPKAANEGSQALDLFRDVYHENPDVCDPFKVALHRTSEAAKNIEDVSAVQIYRKVVADYKMLGQPSQETYMGALKEFNSILVMHRRHIEATKISEEVIRVTRGVVGGSDEISEVTRHQLMDSLRLYGWNLYQIGHFEEAHATFTEAQEIANTILDSPTTPKTALTALLYLQHSTLLLDIGKTGEAIAVLEPIVLSSEGQSRLDPSLLHCSTLLAECYRRAGAIHEAVQRIRISVELWQTCNETEPSASLHVPHILLVSSHILAEAGEKQDAITLAHQAVSCCRSLRQRRGRTTWAETEAIYAKTLTGLAQQRMSATPPDHFQALTLLKEAQEIYQPIIGAAIGHYPAYTCMLETLSRVQCAAGSHREAKLLEKDVESNLHRYTETHPLLSKAIEVSLAELRCSRSFVLPPCTHR